MKKSYLSVAVCLFSSLGAVSSVTPALADDNAAAIRLGKGVNFVPSLLMEMQHDDNVIRSETNEIESWVTVIEPTLALVAEDGPHAYNLLYKLTHAEYTSSKEDSYTDHLVDGSAEWELNSHNRFSLFGGFLDGHEPRGTGFSQGSGTVLDEPDTFQETSGRAFYSLGAETSKGRLDLEGGINTRDYDSRLDTFGDDVTRVRDRDTTHGTVTFAFKVGPKTELLAEVVHRDIEYDVVALGAATLDSDETDYLLGLTWEGSAKTTGTIKVGHREKDFEAGSREDFSGPRWEAGVRWEPLTYSAFDLNTARFSDETNGTGDFIDTENYELAWHHKWLSRLTSTLSYSFVDRVYEGSVREDEQTIASLKLNYQARRWLSLSTGVLLDDIDSNITGFNYDRTVFTVGFQASL